VMPVAPHRKIVAVLEVGDGFSHSLPTGGLETSEEFGLEFGGVHGYKYGRRGDFLHFFDHFLPHFLLSTYYLRDYRE
jgi:hypothetical protein